MSRAVIEGNREVGAFTAEAALDLSDARISGTLPGDTGSGRAMGVQDAAVVRLSRAVVAGSRDVSLYVSDGSSFTVSDVVVRDTGSQETDGTGGRGLNAQRGSQVDVARAVFARSRAVGVVGVGDETVLRVEDVLVSDTAVTEIEK